MVKDHSFPWINLLQDTIRLPQYVFQLNFFHIRVQF